MGPRLAAHWRLYRARPTRTMAEEEERGGERQANRRRVPHNIDALITLKVDNIPRASTAEEVQEVFEKYGEVGDVYIPRDHVTQESRGFAFVRFVDEKDAEDAEEKMQGADFQGRALRVAVMN